MAGATAKPIKALQGKMDKLAKEKEFLRHNISSLTVPERRAMINPEANLPIVQQCQLLGVARSMVYYQPVKISSANLHLMRLIDAIHLDFPFLGSRNIQDLLRDEHALSVSRNRVRRLMKVMGIAAIYRKPRLSKPEPGHKIFPYLLRGLSISKPNQVWATDITYIPMALGFLYLIAIMDWYSRRVLAWRLSNSMDVLFCVEALQEALSSCGTPEIFNTDQGSQFTAQQFTGVLQAAGVQISMDGRGRFLDNIFIERLWRSVKYDEVYLHAYESGIEAEQGLGKYFRFYNTRRPHMGLNRRRPDEVYFAAAQSSLEA